MRASNPVATAAALLVQHTDAYGDLIADDIGTALKAFSKRFWVGVVFSGAVGFSIAMACVWIIAFTWDTPGRLWTIAGLCGLFVLTSAIALLVLRALKDQWQGVLPQSGSEWRKDRLLIEDLLARAQGVPDAGS
jgi:hypothetical protein